MQASDGEDCPGSSSNNDSAQLDSSLPPSTATPFATGAALHHEQKHAARLANSSFITEPSSTNQFPTSSSSTLQNQTASKYIPSSIPVTQYPPIQKQVPLLEKDTPNPSLRRPKQSAMARAIGIATASISPEANTRKGKAKEQERKLGRKVEESKGENKLGEALRGGTIKGRAGKKVFEAQEEVNQANGPDPVKHNLEPSSKGVAEKLAKRLGEEDLSETASPPKKIRPCTLQTLKEFEASLDAEDLESEQGEGPGDESLDPLNMLALSPQKFSQRSSSLSSVGLSSPPTTSVTSANHHKRTPIKEKQINYKESSSDGEDEDEHNDGVASIKAIVRNVKSAAVGRAAEAKLKGKAKVESKKLALGVRQDSLLLPRPSQSHHVPSGSAPTQTQWERAQDWNLNRMDSFVWISVTGLDYEFFWPAEIKSSLRSTRPLELSLVDHELIATFSSSKILLEDPSPSNILSFNSTSDANRRIRFNSGNFSLDNAKRIPSSDDFKTAVTTAIAALEETSDQEEEEEEDGEVEKSSRRSKKHGDTSDDELMKDDDDSLGFEFPCHALVKCSYSTYWPAEILSYNVERKKFNVLYSDLSAGEVPRARILRTVDKQFYTCRMGQSEAELDFPKLLKFSTSSSPTLQLIIKEKFSHAEEWNQLFYGNTKERLSLKSKSRYGMLGEEHLAKLGDVIKLWTEGREGIPKPQGSPRYEGLSAFARADYVTSVLLPLLVILWTASEVEEEGDSEVEPDSTRVQLDEAEKDVESWNDAWKRLEESDSVAFVNAARQSYAAGKLLRKSK